MRSTWWLLLGLTACDGATDADRPFDTNEPLPVIGLQDVFIRPNPVDFGSVPTGGQQTVKVTVRNDAQVDLTLLDVLIEPAGEALSLAQSMHDDIAYGLTLAPGETYRLDVYLNASTPVDYEGVLEIEFNNGARKSVRVVGSVY